MFPETETKKVNREQYSLVVVFSPPTSCGLRHKKERREKKQGMTEVVLHVYDVTNSGSGRANATIRRLNKILRDGMGIGGIFHGAIQVRHLCRNGFIVAKKRHICKKRKEKVLYKS